MNWLDPYFLSTLPLSAYTPGKGDPETEGGWQTATGAPMYSLEMYLAGKAPYVTGATSHKNPSGTEVWRTVGDRKVPVRITDYGPGVKGIDIATTNKAWGRDFPYQGQVESQVETPRALDHYGQMAAGAANSRPMVAATADARPAPLNLENLGQFAVRNYGAPMPYQQAGIGASGYPRATAASAPGGPLMSTWDDYAKLSKAPSTRDVIGIAGGALSDIGKNISQQAQEGGAKQVNQALATMMNTPNPLAALLDQLAENPTMLLPPIRI